MIDIKNLSDEKLVDFIREKDKEFYAEIIRRYQNKLLRYVRYLINDEDLVADIVQNSFIKAYINLKGFDVNKKFSSWIYRIVHNEAINSIKKEKKVILLDDSIDFDSGINLQDDLIRQELHKHTKICIDQIPLKYREPLTLYFLEEKSYEEISDILRLPLGTIGTRISRGKILMKKICQMIKK